MSKLFLFVPFLRCFTYLFLLVLLFLHEDETRPIIEHFEKLDKVRKINAIPGPDEVFEEVKKAFA